MKFKPEDFTLDQYEGVVLNGRVDPIKAANVANAKLEEWLKAAPVVQGEWLFPRCVARDFGSPSIFKNMSKDTHKAKLVAIEKIK